MLHLSYHDGQVQGLGVCGPWSACRSLDGVCGRPDSAPPGLIPRDQVHALPRCVAAMGCEVYQLDLPGNPLASMFMALHLCTTQHYNSVRMADDYEHGPPKPIVISVNLDAVAAAQAAGVSSSPAGTAAGRVRESTPGGAVLQTAHAFTCVAAHGSAFVFQVRQASCAKSAWSLHGPLCAGWQRLRRLVGS